MERIKASKGKEGEKRDKSYKCKLCKPPSKFMSRSDLHRHKTREHAEVVWKLPLQKKPWEEGKFPWGDLPGSEEMERIYQDNEVYILAAHQLSDPIVKVFNFPTAGFVDDQHIQRQMHYIYAHPSVKHSFKVQIAAGVILYRNKDQKYRYFKPSSNVFLLDSALLVTDMGSLEKAIVFLQEKGLDSIIRTWRAGTEWVVLAITNLEYFVYTTNFPLAGENTDEGLPAYIKRNKGVRTMGHDERACDDCCLIVSIVQFLNPETDPRWLLRKVQHAVVKWEQFCKDRRIDQSCPPGDICGDKGIQIRHIHDLEQCFGINISLLKLSENGVATTEVKSLGTYEKTMYANIYKHHINLIISMRYYAKMHACAYCGRLFTDKYKAEQHERVCTKMSKIMLRGGCHVNKYSIFERLDKVGIVVPLEKRVYKHFVLYDLEAMLKPVSDEVRQPKKLKYVKIHHPISVAFASSVEGFLEPECVINPNVDELVQAMFSYFDRVRQKALAISLATWGKELEDVRFLVVKRKLQLLWDFNETIQEKEGAGATSQRDHCVENVERETEAADDDNLAKFFLGDPLLVQYVKLERDFTRYINQLIICTFNGNKYDIPLTAAPLIKYLQQHEEDEQCVSESVQKLLEDYECEFGERMAEVLEEWDEQQGNIGEGSLTAGELYTLIENPTKYTMGKTHVIKRGNRYINISNGFYSFMDLCNFLPPATSYRKFLLAFDQEDGKLYFPYSFLDSEKKLDYPLPPYPGVDWYDELRCCDLLDVAHDTWVRNGKRGIAPPTGEEIYISIQNMWKDKGFVTMADYLKAYNSADVGPGIYATNQMIEQYFAQGLDLFKQSVSVAGLARIKIFNYAKQSNVKFPLFTERERDLQTLFRSSITAGASIIYQRYAEKDKTTVHPHGGEKTQAISVWDANALYLYCCSGQFPSQQFIRRRADTRFKPETNVNFYKMQVWLEHMADTMGVDIMTKYSLGEEVAFGPYRVDGLAVLASGELISFEFNGCYYHFHDSPTCKLAWNSPFKDTAPVRDAKRLSFIEQRVSRVITCWECQFDQLCIEFPHLKVRLNALKPPFYRRHHGATTEAELLSALTAGTFYGFLLVDIEVPQKDRWMWEISPPLYANVDISFNDVGKHMQDHLLQSNIKFKTRRMLVSGMAAEQLLLSSELAKWYVERGLIITKIHQVIEFTPTTPFEGMVKEVTRLRREADVDPNKTIMASVAKLIG